MWVGIVQPRKLIIWLQGIVIPCSQARDTLNCYQDSQVQVGVPMTPTGLEIIQNCVDWNRTPRGTSFDFRIMDTPFMSPEKPHIIAIMIRKYK